MAVGNLPITADYTAPAMVNGVDFMAGQTNYPDTMAFDLSSMDPEGSSRTSNTMDIPTPSEESTNSSSQGNWNGGNDGSLHSSSESSLMEIQTQNFGTDLSEVGFQNIFNDL